MLGKTVRLEGDNDRWISFAVDIRSAMARVGRGDTVAEPFPFSFENFGYVLQGLGYQSWGGGSHFTFRRTEAGFEIEFQGTGDRSPAIRHLTEEELAMLIAQLDPLIPATVRATLL